MEVFISIDMEGVAGIAHIRQVMRGTDDYPRARELMTEEANASVRGAFAGGATRVVVNDSHGDMTNLLPDLIDPRAELTIGSPKVPHSMMTGIGPEFGCALFLGYHAGAGTQNAILDHTYAGFFVDVRVNGEAWNETILNAALAGTFNVPVALVVGDRACCQQAEAGLPGVRTVAVKEAFGQRVGRSLSPEWARTVIKGAAEQAVIGSSELRPFRPKGPYTFEVEGSSTAIADMGMLVPRTERPSPRVLRYETDDIRELYQVLLAWMNLGRHVAPRHHVE